LTTIFLSTQNSLKYKVMYNGKLEFDNAANLKYEHSICNQHTFNAMVYVDDAYRRIGLILSLMKEGYYFAPYAEGGLKHLMQAASLYNPVVEIANGEIHLNAIVHRYDKNGKMQRYEWMSIIKDGMAAAGSTLDDIELYLKDRNEFRKSNSHDYDKPLINCGTDVDMFEHVMLLRDDDAIFDIDERKKLGIYGYKRLFTNTLYNDISRFANMDDFDEKHQAFPHYHLTDIHDILKHFEIGKIIL